MSGRFMFRVVLSLVLALLGCSSDNGAFAQDEKMIFAVDVIRHGDRSPVTDIPSAQYAWPQGLGQLSPEGMQQEFQLGCEFRQRYVERYHLLPPNYLAETMHVRSTDIDRTLMSAECVLMGLYPAGVGPVLEKGKPALPFQYQPLPIHTVPRDQDSLLVPDSGVHLGAVVDQYVHASPEWMEYSAKVEPQFDRWSKLLGVNITKLNQVGGLGDSLHIYQLHHIPLPKGMTDDDAKAIIDAGEWAFAQGFKPPQVGDCTGHELLVQIASYLDQASQHATKLRFVLFSAHDSTIAGVMSAMRAPLDRRPPYSSDLNIALFDEDGHYVVKVKLNAAPVSIPGATGGAGSLSWFETLAKGKN